MSRLLVGLSLFWPIVAFSQPEPFDPTALSIDGKWTSTYWDLHLGPVRGDVQVDEVAGTAIVTYHTVFDETPYVLTSESITRAGDRVIIELEGRSPARFIDDGLGYPKNSVILPQNPATMQVQAGATSAGMQIQPRADSDLDSMRLELTVTSPTSLEGIGRFRADPFTHRDRRGGGRYSQYRKDEQGVGWQDSTEIWRRPEPVVLTTIVVPDQLSYAQGFSDLPNYPYRFQDNRHRREKDYRELAIIGLDLPQGPRYPARFEAENNEISFSFVRYGERINKDPNGNDDLSRAQDKLLRLYPDLVEKVGMDKLDFILVRADFAAGTLPGLHTFTMNGQTDTWKLAFGDNRATLDWVRSVRPTSAGMDGRETEPTHDLYSPEEVMVEVATELNLDVDTIWVMLGKNGQLQKMSARGVQIPAHRVQYPPNTFRTRPIRLVTPGSPAARNVYRTPAGNAAPEPDPPEPDFYTITVEPDDRLEAALFDDSSLISVVPEPAVALVSESPASLDTDWVAWLKAAARCHDDVTFSPGAATNHEAIEQFNERRLFFWDTLSTTVQLGDHAALMLLRHTYLELMRARWEQLVVDRDDSSLVALRRSLEPSILAMRSVLGGITVKDASGADIFFWETFKTSNQGTRYKAGVLDVPAWVLQATRQALVQYGDILQESINVAADMDPCDDIQDMLELTSIGFEPVVQVLFPRLMKPGAVTMGGALSPSMEPDYNARFRIWRIAQLAEQVKTYEKLADEDTQLIFQAVTIALVPVSMGAGAIGPQGAVWAQRFAYAVEAAEIAWDTYLQVSEAWASADEVGFARGSVEILGYERYERAQALEISPTQVLAAFGLERTLDFYTNRLADLDTSSGKLIASIQQNRLRASRRRGFKKFSAQSTMNRKAWVDSLTKRDLVDINNYLENLMRSRANSPMRRVLSDYDMRTLSRGNAALNTQEIPDWVRGIGLEHNDYLRRIHRRADVQNLDASEQAYLRSQLNAAGRRGEEARNQLLFEPWRGMDDFNTRLERRMSREYQPLGQEAFDQADPANAAGRQAVRNQGFEFAIDADDTGGAAIISVRGPDGGVDKMWVSFYRDDNLLELNTIQRENVPGNIGGDIPVRQNPNGFPTFTFGQMRYLHRMGVGYGGSGRQALAEIRLENVLATRTNAQLAWYKNALHPEKSWSEFAELPEVSELLKNSRSLEYVRTLANLSGYRVTRARLEATDIETEIGGLFDYHTTGIDGDDFGAMLRRYGLEHDSNGPGYFDIRVELEPHPSAVRNMTVADTKTPSPQRPDRRTTDATSTQPVDSPDTSTTARLPIEMPPSARAELSDAIDRYNADAAVGEQIDESARGWINDLLDRQVQLGVSEEAAVGFVRRHLQRFGQSPNRDPELRADLLALSVIGDGNRQISLEDFAQAAGVSEQLAEQVASRAATNVGLALLPGTLSPARFYPDVGTSAF